MQRVLAVVISLMLMSGCAAMGGPGAGSNSGVLPMNKGHCLHDRDTGH